MTTRARIVLRAILALMLAVLPWAVEAQPRLYRVGVVLHGGQYSAAVEGLREGLGQLGFLEGKQYVLHVRETRGSLKSVDTAARGLESEKVDLVYSLATSVTLAVKRATKGVPIVFYAGTDPVAVGLVESFSKPGGRLTGIHGRYTDLTAKRLQILKEMIPGLRRVVTFYNPENPSARESLRIAREGARQLDVDLDVRTVGSVEELRAALNALRPGEVDAVFYVSDAMVTSQAETVINIAMSKKLPVMFGDSGSAESGALASYGVSYYAIGRLSARQVQRVLLGAAPADLPIEQLDAPYFVINLRTAKALGLPIPPALLVRADRVVQ